MRCADCLRELIFIGGVFGGGAHNDLALKGDAEPRAFTRSADENAVLDAKTAHHVRAAHIKEVGIDRCNGVLAVRYCGAELILHIGNGAFFLCAVGGHGGLNACRALLDADRVSADGRTVLVAVNDLGVNDACGDLNLFPADFAELVCSV